MFDRYLTLADVAEVLNISADQARALVRSGELPAMKIGGRGVWRIGETDLDEYIRRMYAQTEAAIRNGTADLDSDDDAASAGPGAPQAARQPRQAST